MSQGIPGTEIERLLKDALPDADISLEDLTGTEDHWSATVVSSSFEGKNRVQRQRMVYAALAEPLKGPLHALALKTLTPGEAEEG